MTRRALLVAAALLAVVARGAAMHAPHDVATAVALSPDFANDRTVFARMQLTNRMLLARSTDAGDTWELIGAPMMVHGVKQFVFSPGYASDRTVFAPTDLGGVWRTTDGGDTWHETNAGLTSTKAQAVALSPDFALDDTLLVATVGGGVFRSTDRGDSWTPSSVGITDTALSTMTGTADPLVYFTGRRELFKTVDGGATWASVQTFAKAFVDIQPSPAYVTDDTLTVCFGRHGGGILVSDDGGVSFTPSNPADEYVNDVEFAADGAVLAVTESDGCFVAPGPHGPWTLSDDGFEILSDQTDSHYTALAVSPDYATDGVAFVAAFEGLHRSDDAAASWTQCDVYSQLVNKRVRFAPTFDGHGEVYFGNYGGGVYVYRVPPELDARPARGGPTQTSSSSVAAPSPVVGAPGGPSGTTVASPWSLRSSGLGTTYCLALALSPEFAQDDLATYGFAGLWRSVDAGAAWDAIGLPTSVSVIRDLSFSPAFADDLTIFASTSKEPQLRSLDGGLSWQTMSGGLPPDLNVQTIAVSSSFADDGLVLLGSDPAGVWRSTDGGDTWSASSSGLSSLLVRKVALSPDVANDGVALAGTVGDGVFRSTDGGQTWSASNTGLPSDEPLIVESIAFGPEAATDGTVFLALLGQGLRVSHDLGLTWQPVGPGLPPSAPREVALSPRFAHDRTLVVTTYDWSYISRDAGASWQRLPGFQRVDELHQAVQAVGDGWSPIASPESFGGFVAASDEAGDERRLRFVGDSVTWYATRDTVSGQADVFVDGALAATVDLYAPTEQAHVPVFTRSFPGVGAHTITVRVTGTASAPATDTQVQSDGFAYTF